MPKKKFADAQIALVVKELMNGVRVKDVCRKLAVSDATGEPLLRLSLNESIA